jgi:hypothetical protein
LSGLTPDRSDTKRFVFVTDELPRPGRAGHLALNHEIIAWLQGQGHHITILLTSARLAWPVVRYPAATVAGPVVVQIGGFVGSFRPAANARILAKGVFSWLPVAARRQLRAARGTQADAVLGSFITAAQAAWCARYIAAHRPDAVLVDTIFRAALLREPALAGTNSVIIAHDVFHRRYGALVSAGYRVQPAALTRAAEAALLSEAQHIAAIQPEEAAIIRQLCPAQNVFTAAMPVLPCPRPDGTDRLADRLVFIGSASLPNLDGLRWFFEDVWPNLRRWRARLTLALVGDCGRALPRLPEGVERLGRVTDLAPVLHTASLAIAPLRVGSGLKIKMLDYARHGLFTVATAPSLEGFAPDPAAPFIAAANATGFAAAVIKQLDAGAAPDQLALDYVSRHYGQAACFAGLRAALALPDKVLPRESVSAPFPQN